MLKELQIVSWLANHAALRPLYDDAGVNGINIFIRCCYGKQQKKEILSDVFQKKGEICFSAVHTCIIVVL